MNKEEFTAFLELLMIDDDISTTANLIILTSFADREATKYGYTNWIDAYHELCYEVIYD